MRPAHARELAIVGPFSDSPVDIAVFEEIWAVNETHDWLLSYGITPSGAFITDSGYLEHPARTIYYVTCDIDARPCVRVQGEGSTPLVQAVNVAFFLGYRTFHLFGVDKVGGDKEVTLGERTFEAEAWILQQASELMAMTDRKLHIYGPGLLQEMTC